LYINKQKMDLTALEYHIVRYLLRYSDDPEKRTHPGLAEHCWGDSDEAQLMRKAFDETVHANYVAYTGKQRKAFMLLNNKTLGIRITTKRHISDVIPDDSSLDKITYCIIETNEQP
jgi:hypothetical protein